MYLEFAILTGVIILVFILITEVTRMLGLGLIAGVLLLFLSYWIYGDGIQYNAGYNLTSTEISDCGCYQQLPSSTTLTNQTMTSIYAPLPTMPFVDMPTTLAFIFLLSGLYCIVHYSMDIVK